MSDKSTQKPRRPRVPQRYYYAADVLKRVFRWNHIHAHRGQRWKLSFRVRALVKLAGIPESGDAADDYLDALAALQERGELDSPEVQKHTGELREAAERVLSWHEETRRRVASRTASSEQPQPSNDDAQREGRTAADLEGLRLALRRLEESGEASSESAIFRLRQEIHRLAHADPTPADEWPDWIPG